MVFEDFSTQRLLLRKLTPEVYTQLYSTMNDEELMDVLSLDTEALQKEKDKYNKGLSTYNRSFVYFQLIEKQTGGVIGSCGFHTWYPEHNRAEIGYSLYNDEHKGKGFMTEAVAAVLDYGFNQMNLHRVEALTATYNTTSLNILKKFNFVYEGTLREHYNVNGVMEDSIAYSLLRNEFHS